MSANPLRNKISLMKTGFRRQTRPVNRRNVQWNEIGPFDSMIKTYIGGAKDFMERILLQVKVPKIVQNPSGGGISFQLDQPPDGSPVPQCKECKLHASEALVGTWHIVLWSNNFLITVIADLDSQIDKLEANQPVSNQRSLFDWLADPPDLICPQLTILSPEVATKFEFAYTVNPGGKHKSIINKWDRQADSSIFWHLTPVLKLHICPTIVEPDLVVLRQIDSFPRCDNVIVLIRNDLTNTRIDSIRDTLEAEKQTLPSNSFIRTKCPMIAP